MKSFLAICVLLCAAHIDAIINGYSAPQSPYHVYVFAMQNSLVGLAGGGILISSSHILTAGNLIQNYVEWRCRLGSPLLAQARQIIATNATLHPNYAISPRQNDIGIITLPNSISSFSVDIAPIALPPYSLLTNLPLENEQGAIIGFGSTSATSSPAERLQRGHQRVTASQRCNAFFVINNDSVGFFCAEDSTSRANICNQDLGGGFVVSLNGVDTLVGISAIVLEACDANGPSAYTRIRPHREWIRTITSV